MYPINFQSPLSCEHKVNKCSFQKKKIDNEYKNCDFETGYFIKWIFLQNNLFISRTGHKEYRKQIITYF